jgi:hypothetical protein
MSQATIILYDCDDNDDDDRKALQFIIVSALQSHHVIQYLIE